MIKNVNKPILFLNIVSVVVIIYFLKGYRKRTNVLDKLYEFKNWLSHIPFLFYKKQRTIKLPIIDKNIAVDISDEELEERFVQTCNAVKIYRNKLKFEEWIYLYGLFKQITMGNIKLNNEEENENNENENENEYNENGSMNKINELKLKNNDYIEKEKINSWKNCYNVDKKVCKYLYVEYFNKLFPDVMENLNNNMSFEFSKSISKIKKLTDHSYNEDNIDGTNNLCDLLCDNVVYANVEYIKNILDSHPYLVNQKNSNGLTALHYACDRGHVDIVKLLVEKGADVNIEDSCGDSALHIAAHSDKKKIIDYLISVGADINKKNSDGLTVYSILDQK